MPAVEGSNSFPNGTAVYGNAPGVGGIGVLGEGEPGVQARSTSPSGTALYSEGNVRIGTSEATHRLTVRSAGVENLRLIGPFGSFGHGARLNFGDEDFAYMEEDIDDNLRFVTPFGRCAFDGIVGIRTTTPTFSLEVNGTAGKPGGGSWSLSSDARLKQNVRTLEGSLDKLLALRGVSFEFKDPESIRQLQGERIGLIAQEVEEVFPDWIDEGPDGYKRLTVRGFEALTVEALRELHAANDQLRRDNEALRVRLVRLEASLREISGTRTEG